MEPETISTIIRLLQQCRQHEYTVSLGQDGPLVVEYINGGHLNHVGRVKSADGSKTCIVKVYMDYVKFLGPSMPIEADRCQREFLASHYFRSLYPGCCPLSYFFDDAHKIGFLEDFPKHVEWGRTLLNDCDLRLGIKIADMLVAIHSGSHRTRLSSSQFDILCTKFRPLPKQANFLCQAQLVKPFLANHREYKPSCQETVRLKVDQVISEDVVTIATKLVREWMSVENGDCCIHGDLHVENILVSKNDQNIMLIDTDCVRIGPEAYDVGLLLSNYLLIYHYHRELRHKEAGRNGPDHTQLMTDMLDLITSTLSRYLDGMSHAVRDKLYTGGVVWRQILLFMAVEAIGWISGPASFDYIDTHPQVMLDSLDTALNILQRMPRDVDELSHLILQGVN